MLVESVLLALIGGAGGILLASAGTAGLSTIAFPIDATITLDATPDLGVLVASFVLATLTGVLFGLGPALRSARTDLTTSLKEGAQGARLSHKKTAFLVGQLALSTLLLLTAGLFLRSYLAVADVPLGFEADGVTVASLSLATHGYSEEEGRRFYEELIDRVRAAPGVESASLGRFVLLGGTNASNRGRAVDAGQDAPDVNIPYNVVDPEYFRTNRMELVAGRFLTPSDAEDTPYVAVVNQTLAQRLWPDQPAIGRSFRVGRREHEVVGVVRDGVYVFVYEDRRAFAYYPFGQRYGGSNTLHVRSAAPAAATSAAIRAIVNDLDPNVGVAHVRTMGEVVSSNGFIVDSSRCSRRSSRRLASCSQPSVCTVCSPCKLRSAVANSECASRSAHGRPRCCCWWSGGERGQRCWDAPLESLWRSVLGGSWHPYCTKSVRSMSSPSSWFRRCSWRRRSSPASSQPGALPG